MDLSLPFAMKLMGGFCSFWGWNPEVWIWTAVGKEVWAVVAFHWLQAVGECAEAKGCRCERWSSSEGKC